MTVIIYQLKHIYFYIATSKRLGLMASIILYSMHKLQPDIKKIVNTEWLLNFLRFILVHQLYLYYVKMRIFKLFEGT